MLTTFDTSAESVTHFRDSRPPHAIQFALERELKILLRPSVGSPSLVLRGEWKLSGCPLVVELCLEAALETENCYALRFAARWDGLPAEHHVFYRQNFERWVPYWASAFRPAPAPPARVDQASVERYRCLADQVLTASAQPADVHSLQQEILSRIRGGATYSTANKEGGTLIRWQSQIRRFVKADHGESEERIVFEDDASFLAFLRRFWDWETSSAIYPDKVPEIDAWRLMLRFLR